MNKVTIDLDRLDEDEARLKRARDEIDQKLASIAAIRNAAVHYGVPSSNGYSAPPNRQVGDIVDDDDLADKTVHEAAEIVLRKADQTMKTKEIADTLLSMGYREHVRNFQTAVYTAMNRKPETFRKVSPGEWALTEWQRNN